METIPLTGVSIWLVAKIFVLIAILLYLVFSLVIVRQVKLMIETVEVDFENQIKALSYVHLAFAVIVFIFALLIL